MADDQISLPYFIVILILMGFIVRYLFFNGAGSTPSTRSPEAALRARELAAETIQQMFPQVDRRTILWDLQRNAGNIQNTTERILAGRLETVSRVFLGARDGCCGSAKRFELCRQAPRGIAGELFLTDLPLSLASDHLPASHPEPNEYEHECGNRGKATREARAARSHHPLQPQRQARFRTRRRDPAGPEGPSMELEP